MKEKLKLPPGTDGRAFPVRELLHRHTPHHHDELEVNLILTGKASYLFGRRRVPLLAGSMIWLFPRQEHVLIDWSHDFSMWVLVFKPRLVQRCTGRDDRAILRSPDPGNIFCRQVDPRQADALSLVYQSAAEDESDLEFTNAALGYALLASWQAYRFSHETAPHTDVHPAVARAARLISQADEAVSLNQLARQAGLSPARLSRLFKQQTGVSLTTYRQRKCLKTFLRLYRTGARCSLIEAALAAGFGSYPQFHRVFRRLMGLSPLQYKKSLLNAPFTPSSHDPL